MCDAAGDRDARDRDRRLARRARNAERQHRPAALDDRRARARADDRDAHIDGDASGVATGAISDRVAVVGGIHRRLDRRVAPRSSCRRSGWRPAPVAQRSPRRRRRSVRHRRLVQGVPSHSPLWISAAGDVSTCVRGAHAVAASPPSGASQTVSMTRSQGIPAWSLARLTATRELASNRQRTRSSPGEEQRAAIGRAAPARHPRDRLERALSCLFEFAGGHAGPVALGGVEPWAELSRGDVSERPKRVSASGVRAVCARKLQAMPGSRLEFLVLGPLDLRVDGASCRSEARSSVRCSRCSC